MGSTSSAFTCLISSTSSQRPENFYSSVSTYYQCAIMLGQHVDLVAGDFNVTAWRCSNRNNISTIDEAFGDCALPTPPGPTPLWGPGSIPNNWADVCGFLEPPDLDRYWKVRIHGVFSIPGLLPTDQSCHHETRLNLEFVDWRGTQSHHEEHDRRILLKERPTACFSFILFFFRDSFLSALTIHVAQHPSRTSRHGLKKKEVATDIPEDTMLCKCLQIQPFCLGINIKL